MKHKGSLDDFALYLRQARSRLRKELASGLYQLGEEVMADARPRTPVEFGHLRQSGHVELPAWSGSEVSVTVGFGGPAAPYAIYVHENLEAHHEVGQAKYLEEACLTVLGRPKKFADRLVDRVDFDRVLGLP
jgi:hypothetical protein